MAQSLELRVGQKRGDVVAAAGEVVVHAKHLVPFGKQPRTKMRADEAGAAGDEYPLAGEHVCHSGQSLSPHEAISVSDP